MKTLGLILFVLGIVLLGFAWNASQKVTEQVVEGVSGHYTDTTMWYLMGGIAMLIGGGAIFLGNKE